MNGVVYLLADLGENLGALEDWMWFVNGVCSENQVLVVYLKF